jgi:CheY-like chemotaxis protein
VNARVGNLEHMLHRLIGADIALATRLHAEQLPVLADPCQVEQVIMNLVVNARDAMPDGGALAIETSAVRLDPTTHLPADGDGGQPYALLAVTDSGVGMDDHVKSHLFEPFFTTKEQGKGTGLGLAMVYGILQQSAGHVEVVSAPGQGTTFKIYLPLTEESCPAVERPDKRTQRQPRGTETILLVEDEAGVRALASNALRHSGYNVLECADGAKALALFESFAGPIHLMITDMVMPCMGGVDLARHVARDYPQTKVLFISGYPDPDFAYGPETMDRYLQKPFSPQDLTSRIRKLLDSDVEAPVGV